MEPMLAEFERIASGAAFSPPKKPLVSNVTGGLAGAEVATPRYWTRHVRQPVRFAAGMETLRARGFRVFVEIGPASTLLGLGRLSVPGPEAVWLPSLGMGGDWNRLLQSLAELYVRGAEIDWPAFDREYRRRLVALPTYPFQRQRYWVDVERKGGVTGERPQTAVAGNEPDPRAQGIPSIREMLYEVAWRERPRVGNVTVTPPADGSWVVFADRGGVAARVAEELRGRGARCTLVSSGAAFTHVRDGRTSIDAATPEDTDRLLAAVSSDGAIRGVVDLRSLDGGADLDAASFEGCAPVEGALQIVQCVTRRGRERVSIWCVTRGGVAAGNGSAAAGLSVAQAPLWGFGRVAALEHPETWGGLLDLSPAGSEDFEARVLVDELLAPDGESEIAFRGGARLVPRLVRRPVRADARLALDPDGTYLVVGGLGALGLHAARWLVANGVRRLVLASRRGMATPGAADVVRSLEASGATVIVSAGDVSREEDVDSVLRQIAASGAPLRGVVHAAGVDARVPLADMTASNVRRMLASKLTGAWLLHDRTRHLPLDLFVCFSSVSSIWGAPGRAHYAAANAALDALVHERRRLGLPGLSVNWGPWRGGGMAGAGELDELERSGIRGLDPAAALRALDALVAGGAVQGMVADVDWPRFRAVFDARLARPLLQDLGGVGGAGIEGPSDDPLRGLSEIDGWAQRIDQKAAATAGADWIERLQRASREEREALLQNLLRAEVARTLGYDDPADVAVDQSVFELGMDSLRAVELSIRLQQHLGLERAIQFFDAPEVQALAERLLDRIALPSSRSRAFGPGGSQPGPDDVTPEGVVRYTPDLEQEIFAFSRAAWPNRPDHLVEVRWPWMFVQSARRLGVDPRVWLYRDGGRVVAHHGAIPVRLQAGSDVIDSAWFVDTMVLESHRSTAAGARLLIDSNDEFPVGLSLGQTEQMRTMALRLGWEQVAPLQTFVLLLRPQRVLGDKLHPLAAGVAGAGLNARRHLKRYLAGPRGGQLAVRTVDRFDARHDALWASVSREYGCAVVRDASYLNWKYVAQPGQHFVRLELLRAGEIVAVMVLALDEPGAIYRYRRALLVDLVVSPSDSATVLGLLDALCRHCDTAGVDAVVFHVINARLEALARAYGFMRREPTRFLLVRQCRASDAQRRQLLSAGSWLVTMGDSDIDRPWETFGDLVQIRATPGEASRPAPPLPRGVSAASRGATG
jgi:acyl carrier protein